METKDLIKLLLLGVGGYLVYQHFYGSTAVVTAGGTGTGTGGGTTTGTNTGTAAHPAIPAPPASGNGMVQALQASAGVGDGATYNVSQWNWFLGHVDATLAPLQIVSDPGNITAAQYVSLRNSGGYPIQLTAQSNPSVGSGTGGNTQAQTLAAALASASGGGVNFVTNIDGWNYYVSQLYPTAPVLDPMQAGFTDRGPAMTASQYVDYRRNAGLTVTISNGGLSGRMAWTGLSGWNPGNGWRN